jgi:flavorubredoxin
MVIYDTKFGNTERIANSLAAGINEMGYAVDVIFVENVQLDKITEYELLAIGGPTHGFGISAPIRKFIKRLDQVDLRNKKAFAFDTKSKGGIWGSAAKGIEKRMKEMNMNIIKRSTSAIVLGLKGPLQDGSEELFRQIGVEIASA